MQIDVINDTIEERMKWLDYIIVDGERKSVVKESVDKRAREFEIENNVIVNIGAVVQKGEDWCLDGFVNFEIGETKDIIEKFCFEAMTKFINNVRKIYIIGIIIAISDTTLII